MLAESQYSERARPARCTPKNTELVIKESGLQTPKIIKILYL